MGGVERAQRHVVSARGRGSDLILAENALSPTRPPPDLEQLRRAARLAALPLRVPGRRGRLLVLGMCGPRLAEQEESERRRVAASSLAAGARREEAVFDPGDAGAVRPPVGPDDHGIGPDRPEVGPRDAPPLDRVAAFIQRLLEEGAVHDVRSEAVDQGRRAGGGSGHRGSRWRPA